LFTIARLLDLITSQNSSYAGQPGTPISSTEFTLIGKIRLNATQATGTIRVDLWATLGVSLLNLPALTTITLRIVRGTQPTDLRIYEAQHDLSFDQIGTQVVTIQAADFNPPPGLLDYTLFAQVSVVATRGGPESFGGIAVSN
jgi:hypothetical protein